MVSDDVILEQVENAYDPAGNVILTVTRQRYHNAPASQAGPLEDPSTTPKARVTYVAFYHDPIGRLIATADYGTNGGVPLTRSPTIPASSDTVLVTRQKYDRAGNVSEVTDPSGMVTKYEYDAAGRKTKVIENYQVASSSSSSSSSSGGCQQSDDVNRTTRFTYTPDGQQATLTAENPRTGDQTTTWTYGTTLADSEIASSQLLRSVAYPDSTGSGDTVRYTYNRQGERITLTDQRGCVHTYDRDKLGRVLHDRVTTLGSGVDGAVRRLSTTYDVRGLTSKLTSWNNASVNSGDVVNECQFTYNDFMQLIADYQNHSGAVNTSTTPKVQYGYADGSANTIRPVTTTYPNGRIITYDYGTANGINDAASRIASLIDDDDTHLVDYSFLGLGIIVVADYTEPDVKYTLVDLSGTNDPDTGDIYSGLDRFGRVKDCRWRNYGNNTDTVRLKYGYDRASNRLWRADLVSQSLSKDFDELYSYDGLHRLKDMQRGLLNGSNTAVSDQNFAQCWSLDPTSNWHGFKEAATGGSWTLDQSRSANTVNEITGITNWTGPTWVTPAYDAAGNTTTIPQPADPTESYTGTYDAWNRLVKLADDATDDTVQENQYDARNFRVVRIDYTAGVLSEARHFYYTSRWQSVEERLGSTPSTADAERQFVWGRRYIDDLVLRDRDNNDDSTLDERLYCLQDANWNMVALIDPSATAQERYLYSPFGWPDILDGNMSTVLTISDFDIECLFTSQRFDWTIKLHQFRNRWFDSVSGRFITRDPKKYHDGPNGYAGWFVPNLLDPKGTLKQKLADGTGEPLAGTCGRYFRTFQWILADIESKSGGYIVQLVADDEKHKDCQGKIIGSCPSQPPFSTFVPKNKRRCPANRNSYLEMWIIAEGGEFSSLGTGFDVFAYPGVSSKSQGVYKKTGTAWFIPFDAFDKPNARTDFESIFGIGKDGKVDPNKGVINAGDLPSNCADKKDLAANIKKYTNTTLEKLSSTSKVVTARWNCCEEQQKTEMTINIDGKEA